MCGLQWDGLLSFHGGSAKFPDNRQQLQQRIYLKDNGLRVDIGAFRYSIHRICLEIHQFEEAVGGGAGRGGGEILILFQMVPKKVEFLRYT